MQIASRAPDTAVRCAYLELCTPSLPHTVESLAASGTNEITIVPMFLGAGRHAREDLPALVEQLRLQYPRIRFELQPAVGGDPRLLNVLATIALVPQST